MPVPESRSILTNSEDDDRPIALRRKRRRTSLIQLAEPRAMPICGVPSTPMTPARQKRVRFSFPPDASTGLTQRIARTQLLSNGHNINSPASRMINQSSRRPGRATSTGPVELARLSSDNIEINFKPIRQILSERTKRRLTRSHLSEEMNDCEAERKRHAAASRELAQVKRELEVLTSGNTSVVHEAEKVCELEDEIQTLKQQLRERQTEPCMESSPVYDLEVVDLVRCDDEDHQSESSMLGDCQARRSRSATPLTPNSLLASRRASMVSTPSKSTGTQTKMAGIDIEEIRQHLQSQAQHLMQARLTLEHLLPGETALPLASPTKNANMHRAFPTQEQFPLTDMEPLTTTMLEHLVRMSDQVENSTRTLASVEDQRWNLNNNFRAALHQLEELRTAHAKLLAQSQSRVPRTPAPSRLSPEPGSSGSDKENAPPREDTTYARLFEEAQKRIEKLEEDAGAYDKDRAALISALEKYRVEVKDLEKLIISMEWEHKGEMQTLRTKHSNALTQLTAEHSQAIHDVEAQAEAEAKGRREAEKEIDEVVRRWGDQRERSDRDMGRLNVQIATLTDQLKDREVSISELQQHLAGVRERVESFVSSVGGQLLWEQMEGEAAATEPELPAPHAKPMPPAALSWGLLTPHVDGGRFRNAMDSLPSPDLSSDPAVVGANIEGQVQIHRGKKLALQGWKDSGIGILIEEPEEE